MEAGNYDKLKDIVAQYIPDDVDVSAIQPESNLTSELNINSANLVDIIIDVEDTFDIILENKDMNEMQTVQDALHIIEKKLTDKS